MTDFSALAHGFVFGSPLFGQICQRGGASPSEVKDAMAAALRQELGGEAREVFMQAIVFEARRAQH